MRRMELSSQTPPPPDAPAVTGQLAGRMARARRRACPGRFLGRMIVLLLIWAASASPSTAGAAFDEYQVKATFLFRFTQFVTWPDGAFSDRQSPVVIGVIGEDRFKGLLEEILRGETAHGRPLEVRRLGPDDPLTNCHLLFIGSSAKARVPDVLARLKTAHVLTVGETTDFCQSGGIFNMIAESNRVALEFNMTAARRSGLEVSSRLGKLARSVDDRSAKR